MFDKKYSTLRVNKFQSIPRLLYSACLLTLSALTNNVKRLIDFVESNLFTTSVNSFHLSPGGHALLLIAISKCGCGLSNKNCKVFGALQFGGLSNYWGLQIDQNISPDINYLSSITRKKINFHIKNQVTQKNVL